MKDIRSLELKMMNVPYGKNCHYNYHHVNKQRQEWQKDVE